MFLTKENNSVFSIKLYQYSYNMTVLFFNVNVLLQEQAFVWCIIMYHQKRALILVILNQLICTLIIKSVV